MAQVGKFTCHDCDHIFDAQIGGLMSGEEYACEECDSSLIQPWGAGTPKLVCGRCGGRLRIGLNRKCPKCDSRNTEITKVDIYLD